MRYSVQQCIDRARECDRMASRVKESDAKILFLDLAQQWLELGWQKEDLERDLAKQTEKGPLQTLWEKHD
jgi:hypothetical protein